MESKCHHTPLFPSSGKFVIQSYILMLKQYGILWALVVFIGDGQSLNVLNRGTVIAALGGVCYAIRDTSLDPPRKIEQEIS